MTIRALSPTEIHRFVLALETRYRPVLWLAVTTGFRVSELRTLRFMLLKKISPSRQINHRSSTAR
jgi:hypothetical protein